MMHQTLTTRFSARSSWAPRCAQLQAPTRPLHHSHAAVQDITPVFRYLKSEADKKGVAYKDAGKSGALKQGFVSLGRLPLIYEWFRKTKLKKTVKLEL